MKFDVNSINQSLKLLLFTQYYERPFRPDVGSNINRSLFEIMSPEDPIASEELKNSILEVIQNYEPRIYVKDVILKTIAQANSLMITIIYFINALKETREVTITLKRLR